MTPPENRTLFSQFLYVTFPTAVVLGLFYLGGTYMQAHPYNRPSISAQGETKVAQQPDVGLVTLGVQTGRVPTSQAAIESLNSTMDAVLASMAAIEVKEADVQTSGFSLYPAYDWVDGEQISRGFEASQNVTIKVRNPSKVSDVIAAATNAGANNISNVQFLVEDVAVLQEQARRASIEKANLQAKKLADELGMSLGRLLGYSEDISSFSTSSYGKGGYGGGGGDVMMAETVPLGEQEFTMRVYMQYELR